MEIYQHPIFREDGILTSLMKVFRLHWNDSENFPFIENDRGEILESNDHLFLEVKPTLTLTTTDGEFVCDGILFFGDGCVEFHDKENQDAIHWEYFDEKSLQIIEKYLA